MLFSNTFAKFNDPRMNKAYAAVVYDLEAENAIQAEEVFKVEYMDTPYWQYGTSEGLSQGLEFTGEAGPVPRAELSLGYDQQRNIIQYSLGFAATDEAFAMPGWDKVLSMTLNALGNEVKGTIEWLGYLWYTYSLQGETVPLSGGRPLVDPFSYDGRSVFSDNHRYLTSAITNSNVPVATLTSFTPTTWTQLLLQADGWRDPRNYPYIVKGTQRLVYGDAIKGVQEVMFKSVLNPLTANHDLNIAGTKERRPKGEPIHWSWLPSTDWMIQFDSRTKMNGMTVAYFQGNSPLRTAYKNSATKADGRCKYFTWQEPNGNQAYIDVRLKFNMFCDDWGTVITNRQKAA